MKNIFKTLEWLTFMTFVFVGVVNCQAENINQRSIDSFFLNNGCCELEISFLTSDFNFVFTPERSFVKFLGEDDVEIGKNDVAKVLSLVDSLRFNYSPSGCQLYTTKSGENDKSEDGIIIMMLSYGTFHENLFVPIAKRNEIYFYNPIFLSLLGALSDILKEKGKLYESQFYKAEYMHPWTEQEANALSQRDTVFNNKGENTLLLLPVMNREEYFKTYDVRKLKIERSVEAWHCTIISMSNGGSARFSFPDGTEVRKQLSEKEFNRVINVISQYQLRKHGLLDWVIKSRKKEEGDLSNTNLGYISIVIDKNHGNSTVGHSFLPLVGNKYEYTYRSEFLELLKIVDTWAEEIAMEANE